jgi:crotonobetainyl-CoA:carnitine CoA-transferase CaiB-like acyl-CoA transferase
VEKAGEGDATRGQLRDIPDVDSSTHDAQPQQRSITVNTKDPKGKEVVDRLIKARRAGRELRARRARSHGFNGAHPRSTRA